MCPGELCEVRQRCQAAFAAAGSCACLILTSLQVGGSPRGAEKVFLGARGKWVDEGTCTSHVALLGAGFGLVMQTPGTLGGH